MPRVCPICQKSFTPNPKKKTQTYCSRECWRQSLFKHEQRTCEGCGTVFYPPPNRPYARYCSWECYTEKVDLICEYCGKYFEAKRSHARKRKTCSRSCLMKLRAREKRAPHQGKPRPATVRRKVSQGLKQYYATHPESHWNYKGVGYNERRGRWSDWQRQREQVRQRDGYACTVCGISESELGKQLSVHHIRPFRAFQTGERPTNHATSFRFASPVT